MIFSLASGCLVKDLSHIKVILKNSFIVSSRLLIISFKNISIFALVVVSVEVVVPVVGGSVEVVMVADRKSVV